ncbi:hypothetical protein KRP22_001195 [Phytophthora ramorum]|uniref:uncharacterized protein n=1 Tax=Phytophthora ramorum TaxID=164328 RepID=UPI0030B7EF4F|nr:hypothetical protein KRP23_7953 [Phytophthora ramorum]KAH7508554.1 hypothetical protein KRP22_68 [Phytophthora ramorum]
MLPSLSDKLGSRLQPLTPVVVAPSLLPARRNVLQELKKVEAIQVSCAGKKDWLVIEVFANSATAMTDGEELMVQDDTRRPTIRIERALSEFTHLRDRVYNFAHTSHHCNPCEFCLGILDLVVFGANPDGFLIGLLGGKRMTRTLTQFAEALLEMTLQHTCADTRGCCAAQKSVPQIVHAFFFTPAQVDA